MDNSPKKNKAMKSKIDSWIKQIEDFKKNGLKRADYCHKHQIRLTTFDYWRHQVKDLSAQKESQLVKLPIKIESSVSENIILEYPGGCKLHFPANIAPQILKIFLSRLVIISKTELPMSSLPF